MDTIDGPAPSYLLPDHEFRLFARALLPVSRYPQIYASEEKLLLDAKSVKVRTPCRAA